MARDERAVDKAQAFVADRELGDVDALHSEALGEHARELLGCEHARFDQDIAGKSSVLAGELDRTLDGVVSGEVELHDDLADQLRRAAATRRCDEPADPGRQRRIDRRPGRDRHRLLGRRRRGLGEGRLEHLIDGLRRARRRRRELGKRCVRRVQRFIRRRQRLVRAGDRLVGGLQRLQRRRRLVRGDAVAVGEARVQRCRWRGLVGGHGYAVAVRRRVGGVPHQVVVLLGHTDVVGAGEPLQPAPGRMF